MTIPSGVILLWAGTHAAIPTGWQRETGMDSKYVKGTTGTVGTTGGALSHSHTSAAHQHTMNAHTHTYTLDDISDLIWSADGSPKQGIGYHGHGSGTSTGTSGGTLQNQTVTWSSVNHEPPYYELIFIKPSGGFAPIKNGVIGLWNSSSVPSGYTFCDGSGATPNLRNRYPKGAGTGADAGTTGGATSHQHTISHSHTSSNHSHTGPAGAIRNSAGDRQDGGSSGYAKNTHSHTVTMTNTNAGANAYTNTTAGSGDTVEPGYKKLIPIQAGSDMGNPVKGLIGLWGSSVANIPRGWLLCDGNNGTPDMGGFFLKFANTTGEIGDTGGANTHQHSNVSHTHVATGTHTHTGSCGAGDTTWSVHMNYTQGIVGASHTHPVSDESNNTAVWANANVTCGSSDNQPPYKNLAFIQYQYSASAGFFPLVC